MTTPNGSSALSKGDEQFLGGMPWESRVTATKPDDGYWMMLTARKVNV
jgi:hypothetical protein